MAILKDLAQVNAELQEQKERVDNVDFKMVTFSLAGKDYGVDIMNVKEIAKADKFTYVGNRQGGQVYLCPQRGFFCPGSL